MINKIIHSDALTGLKQLESESVDCCITSPPYYALRDYKAEGQLGLEATFQEYLDKLIAIFNEVKRVLKRTGTCWVVMGDTYGRDQGANCKNTFHNTGLGRDVSKQPKVSDSGLPQKSLMMIPSRFAIAMIDNGWILRNDIIWHKPNCMPSSVKDRFTVDYEHVYFFSKEKYYYFKTQYEPMDYKEIEYRKKLRSNKQYDSKEPYNKNFPYTGIKFGGNKAEGYGNPTYSGNDWKPSELGRIKRSVWLIPPKPFPDAHFAVFPEELVKQCLIPGCPDNGNVLDPFMGSGTTAIVALQNNRNFIGIEINQAYIDLAYDRLDPYLYQTKLL